LVTKIKRKDMKSRIELESMRQTATNETEEIGMQSRKIRNKCLKQHIRSRGVTVPYQFRERELAQQFKLI
jgi:hypothetical protein